MAGQLRYVIMAAPIVGLLAGSSAGYAQAQRPWVDPPPTGGAVSPQTPTPSTGHPSQAKAPEPKTLSASPQSPLNASPEEADTREVKTDAKPTAETASRKTAVKSQTRQKVVSERKTRNSSRQTNMRAKRRSQEEVAVRRDQSTTGSIGLSYRESRNFTSPRGRATRFEQVRRGIDSGLEVMNLRTIQLPNGQRIRILTRPDPEAMSQLLTQP